MTIRYTCGSCGSVLKIKDQLAGTPGKCPKCKKQKLRRLFGTGGAVMFKGSGFYQTDYRSDSYKKAAEADRKSSSESTAKSENKSSDSSSKSDSTGGAKTSTPDS